MCDTLTGNDLLSAWLESEPGPLALVDPGGRYLALNAAMRRLLDWSPEDRLPAPRHPLLCERLIRKLAESEPGETPFGQLAWPAAEPIDLVLKDNIDGEAWLYESKPLLNAAGRVVGWRDRLVPLTPDDPATLRHELSLALRRKDEYLAGVGHELRTPLTAILGFCHLLLHHGDGLSETQASQVRKIHKNASIQLQLLHNVLDLAKLNSGTASVFNQPVDLEAMIREAFEFVEPQSYEKAIELRTELPDLPPVNTDRQKLRQVLINLLGNAVKYTEAGTVTVAATAESDGVFIQVRDTGRGIPEDQQDRIFNAFVRLSDDDGLAAGTGLGLTICARLTRMLGGSMAVESEPGQGSVFTLRLPLEPDPTPV